MLRFTLDLIPALLVGLLLGWCHPGLPGRLAGPLVQVGIPFTLVGLLLRSGLGVDLLRSAAAAALIGLIGLLAVLWLPPLRQALRRPGLKLGAVVGNTGYFGVPVVLALLPPQALGHAISYDLVGTLITWSVGPLLMEGKPPRPMRLLASLGGSPAVRGLLIALLIQASPWAALLAERLWLPARLVLLLALAMVGMRLGVMLRHPGHPVDDPGETRAVRTALGFKLIALPLLALAVAWALRLPEPIRGAVILQAAAPTAVSALLLAEASGSDQDPTAWLVLASTALALFTVPAWWWLLGSANGG